MAFAGFASIVAVLGQRKTRDHPRTDAFRIRGLLESSLVVVAFSLLPYVLARIFSHELSAWRLSSGLFAMAGGVSFLSIVLRRRLVADLPSPLGLRITIFLLYLAPLPVLLLISLNVVGEGSPGIYLLCLPSHLLAMVKTCANECRANPFSLMYRQHRHWGEAHHLVSRMTR